MRALVQRVSQARLLQSKRLLCGIDRGLVILAGFGSEDTPVIGEQMAQKIKNLRLFSDPSGKMNLAGDEVGAHYLLVSQFTLFADCRYGNRPSFAGAGPKKHAEALYRQFVESFEKIAPQRVKSGPFGADLGVSLTNDGPVTLWLDSGELL